MTNNKSEKPKRKDEISCVQLSKETKAKLDKLGAKNETYESIILKQLEKPCAKTMGENESE